MVISADLSDPAVKITGMVVPRGHSERFETMVQRSHPTAAVTGTYFSLRSRVPVGDIVVDGRQVHLGCIGTGLCVTADNQCEFIKPFKYKERDWSAFDFVCCAGPRLVCANQIVINPRAEGFRDSGLLGKAARLAVGITAQNRLLFVATRSRISLGRLAKVMKSLGCMDAINLDAGSSLGFYHGGKFLARPDRQLTNLILIYDNHERYERFKARLTPPMTAASAK